MAGCNTDVKLLSSCAPEQSWRNNNNGDQNRWDRRCYRGCSLPDIIDCFCFTLKTKAKKKNVGMATCQLKRILSSGGFVCLSWLVRENPQKSVRVDTMSDWRWKQSIMRWQSVWHQANKLSKWTAVTGTTGRRASAIHTAFKQLVWWIGGCIVSYKLPCAAAQDKLLSR